MAGPTSHTQRTSVRSDSLRPRLLDLDEFEDDQEALQWPAAATVTRAPPPPILSASSSATQQQQPKKSVRIEAPLQAGEDVPASAPTTRRTRPTAPTSRFAARAAERASLPDEEGTGVQAGRSTMPLNGDEYTAARSAYVGYEEEEEDGEEEQLGAPITAGAPLVGGVRERISASSSSASAAAPSNIRRAAGESRFAASRKLKLDSGASASGFPSVERCSVETKQGEKEEEVWLDEDGHAMSAFRIARLKAAGKGPPSRSSSAPAAASTSAASSSSATLDRSQDAATSSVLKEADAENARKLSAMKPDDVERELEDLKAHFGADMLELLRGRLSAKAADAPKGSGGAAGAAPVAAQSASTSNQQARAKPSSTQAKFEEDDTPEAIRARYFPNEPSAPASLQWMMDATTSKSSTSASSTSNKPASNVRFDFGGAIVRRGEERLGEGLHHHGDEADAAGYTAEELLHLARSTVPAQRVSALNTLQRIVSAFPELPGRAATAALGADTEEKLATSQALDLAYVRQRTALTSTWLLPDRQRSVRHAAIQALRASLASSKRGPNPIAGVEAPRKVAPRFNETFEVAAKRDVIEGLLRARVVTALKEVLLAKEGEDGEGAVDVLALIASHSGAAARAVAAEPALLQAVVSLCLRSQSAAAVVRALELIELLVMADKASALKVLNEPLDFILRQLAMPPWSNTSASTTLKGATWKQLTLTLRILTHAAHYGLGAALLASTSELFTNLLRWCGVRFNEVHKVALQKHEAEVLCATLGLYEAWSACATSAHDTLPLHAVEWSAVRQGAELALEVLLVSSRGDSDGTHGVEVAGAAAALLVTWRNVGERARFDTQLASWEELSEAKLDQIAGCLAEALKAALTLLSSSSEPFWQQAQSSVEQLGLLSHCGTSLTRLAASAGFELAPALVDAARHLLHSDVWNALDSDAALAVGSARPRKALATFCASVLGAVEQRASEKLSLLAKLQPGDEEVAQQLLYALVPEEQAGVLRPFFNEGLRVPLSADGAPFYTPELSSVGAIKRTGSLFLPLPPSVASSEEEAEEAPSANVAEGEEKLARTPKHDVDPVSGARLWRSPTSGLPLRRDWSFQALDDLLHSADCAALNRPDALPSEWDANERDVVAATLQLSVDLLNAALAEQEVDVETLPQAAQVLLACIKVFLLEGGAPTDPRASGKATGRDLFRDASIASSLGALVSVASRLATHASATSTTTQTLEVAAAAASEEVPFYQTYTDLMGLYDGISYGDAQFARALLAPLSMRYARDYRHLLWADYAHLLPTIRTRVSEAPVDGMQGVRAYFSPRETDEEMRMRYAGALVRGTVKLETNELLWRVALHHSVAALWTREERQNVALAKVFFTAPAGSAALDALRRTVLGYDAEATEREPLRSVDEAAVPADEIKRRIEVLRTWLGDTTADAASQLITS